MKVFLRKALPDLFTLPADGRREVSSNRSVFRKAPSPRRARRPPPSGSDLRCSRERRPRHRRGPPRRKDKSRNPCRYFRRSAFSSPRAGRTRRKDSSGSRPHSRGKASQRKFLAVRRISSRTPRSPPPEDTNCEPPCPSRKDRATPLRSRTRKGRAPVSRRQRRNLPRRVFPLRKDGEKPKGRFPKKVWKGIETSVAAARKIPRRIRPQDGKTR